MKSRLVILATIAAAASFIAAPAHLHGEQAADVQQHDHHRPDTAASQPSPTPAPQSGTMGNMANMANMMSRMRANDAKLDQLVKTMQTAQGPAKTDAIAALLTALVEDRKNNCEPMMANMMSMMNMMGGAGQTPGAPATPKN
jgi:hypothetical protein